MTISEQKARVLTSCARKKNIMWSLANDSMFFYKHTDSNNSSFVPMGLKNSFQLASLISDGQAHVFISPFRVLFVSLCTRWRFCLLFKLASRLYAPFILCSAHQIQGQIQLEQSYGRTEIMFGQFRIVKAGARCSVDVWKCDGMKMSCH